MRFFSTRDPEKRLHSLFQAIQMGLSPEGGLFVPEYLPVLRESEKARLSTLSFSDFVAELLTIFSEGELTATECRDIAFQSYQNFSPKKHDLSPRTSLLELFHGPTAAFKDFALQLLPRLLSISLKKTHSPPVCVLVATSGDTGGAALSGFSGISGTGVFCLFPKGGVSSVQRRQMEVDPASNLCSLEIRGDFDAAQKAIKDILADQNFVQHVQETFGVRFSSGNSLNIGRLLPQIFFVLFCLLSEKEAVDVVIPSGNFGNALSAFLAKKIGAPIRRIVVATNANHTASTAIESGIFDLRGKQTIATLSPAMDISLPSNFERLVFFASGENPTEVIRFYTAVQKEQHAILSEEALRFIQSHFSGKSVSDAETAEEIQRTQREFHYLPDPHTAVGLSAARKLQSQTGYTGKAIVFSTAHYGKFSESLFPLMFPKEIFPNSEEEALLRISEKNPIPQMPPSLLRLFSRQRHDIPEEGSEKHEIREAILHFLREKQKTQKGHFLFS